MNKTAIKNFAVWARNKLIADISYRAGLMGITESGIASALPQSTGTTEFYDIGTAEPYSISGDAVRQRRRLVELIERKAKETDYKTAYKYIIEEVAYTWFNRLIAIRFMEVNDYLPSHIRALSSESGKMEPDLVTTPFDADLDFTKEEEQLIIELKQDNKLDELFRLLFIKQCNSLNAILPFLFEETNDYTEVLLNLSVIDQDGVVYHLIHDISEEDFNIELGGQIEIIGWLYQYYNTEPKDDTFALLKKNVKISKERIPAATQLFTPDWIVRYMVENSLGRFWHDGHTDESINDNWQYYLSDEYNSTNNQIVEIKNKNRNIRPEEIKVIDPCMGSGHILVYAFDIFMQIYESAGFTQREAARSIIENNLYGLDIDDRAFQMAYFSVMMKARQFNRRILDYGVPCHVYSIQESNSIDKEQLKYFGCDCTEQEKMTAVAQINEIIDTFKDAKEYGSILHVKNYNWDLLNRFIENYFEDSQICFETVGIDDTKEQLLRLICIAKIMNQKYEIVVTNPPYMGSTGMDVKLAKYVKDNYPDTKSDMSTVCMERCLQMCADGGYVAMINIPVWMFLSSYEKLRINIINNNTFINMVHCGRGIFGSDFGTTAFVIAKNKYLDYIGTYRRLFDKQGAVDSVETKRKWFIEGKGIYHASQNDFIKIPGAPIAYWVGEQIFEDFCIGKKLGDLASTKVGLQTGSNERFIRLWHEVSYEKIGFGYGTCDEASRTSFKWFPYNKGGAFRKWYGNNDYIVNWKNNGYEIKNFYGDNGRLRSRPQNTDFYFKEAVSWSYITSGAFNARIKEPGFIFDVNGISLFADKLNKYLLGFLCSSVAAYFINIINATISIQAGDIARLPVIIDDGQMDKVITLVEKNIELCKADWDSFEMSWNFKKHPLIGKSTSIEDAYLLWEKECANRFEELKKNEETLNDIFIQIYKVEGEIDSCVEDRDITVRKADVKREIHSLISYAIGCIFGRYSLDVDGICYAGGEWIESNYSTYIPDKDNIIPITDEEYFADDIVGLLCLWLKKTFGEKTLEKNLEYIANVLGTKGATSRECVRNYFLSDFYKEHCATYSVTGSGKRPIYWMLESGKQNGFKALVYLHRYTEDTIGNVRIDYLHRVQRVYESEISRMQDIIDNSKNARDIANATKRKEKLQKQLKECKEYDEKIGHLALARTRLELDDGVIANYEKLQIGQDGKKYSILAKI